MLTSPAAAIYWIFHFCIVWHFYDLRGVHGEIVVGATRKSELIEYASRLLCSYHLRTIHVYFENQTWLDQPGQILRELNDCDEAFITMRATPQESNSNAIRRDTILMYLVIIVQDITQKLELTFIQRKSAGKHLAHVFVFIIDSRGVTEDWLREAFHKFWDLWFLNIVIFYGRQRDVFIYRYDPFTDEFLIRLPHPKHRVPMLSELFPKTLPNMKGKPLNVCMYHDNIRAIFQNGRLIGSDGLMSEYIAQRFNATRVIHRVNSYGNISLSLDLCLHEVADRTDDIALNIRFLALPTFEHMVEPTIVHTRDDLCVMVPKAKIASTFWNIFRTFDGAVWLLIIATVPLVYIFCSMVYHRLFSGGHLLLELFAMSLTMPMSHVPTKYSLRLFLFFWLFYGMLICGAFRGTLTSNLVFRKYLPDIDTIKDLALSPYNIVVYPRHMKHMERYLNTNNSYEARIWSKLLPVSDADLINMIESNNLSYAYLQKYHIATKWTKERRHSAFGRPLFHNMETCLVPFHAVYILPLGSPHLGFVNTLIRSSHEFGFNLYWERLTQAVTVKSSTRATRSHSNEDDPVVLKLNHFKAVFFLLYVGLSLSAMVCCWEILWDRRLKRKWRVGYGNCKALEFTN